MQQNKPKKLPTLDLAKSLDHNMVLALAVALVLSVLSLTPAGEAIDDMTRAFEFEIRAMTEQRPVLSPKIKIISFDDASTTYFGYHDLSLAKWNYLFYGLSRTKPHAVYILHPFHSLLGDSYTEKFNERMGKFKFPIFTAALTPNHPLDRKPSKGHGVFTIDSSPRWYREAPPRHVYGPATSIQASFAGFGHIESAGVGKFRPVVRIGENQAVPHIALAGTEPRLQESTVNFDDVAIPVSGEGVALANILSAKDIQPATYSLGDIYEKIKTKESLDEFNPGDVLVILPQMSSGHAELRPTPLGEMPLNLIQLAIINSRLTNRWLSEVSNELLMIVLFSILGCLTATWLRNVVVLPIVLGAVFSLSIGSLALFIYADTVLSWLFPALGMVSCATTTMIRKSLQSENVAKLIRHGLEGRMSPERIKTFLASSGRDKLIATEQDVSVMFIDIVGFSRSANSKDPQGVFANLKRIFGEIRETVHEYGGDVDRTMGDALLCVFGYQLGKNTDSISHADQALKCAEAIQRANVTRIVSNHQEGVVFPLRIGINTAKVYVGNLGDERRVDLTVIGAGVNFAQRLESSCDRHMIMVGPETKNALRHAADLREKLVERMIRVKHDDDLNSAFEYNPFVDDPGYLNNAEGAYRKFINAKRVDARARIPDSAGVVAETILGRGKIIDVSQGGLALELPAYLAVGVPLAINFVSANDEIELRFRKLGLVPLTGLIRWGRCVDGKFIHGLEYKNLTRDQKEKIYEVIADAVSLHQKAG